MTTVHRFRVATALAVAGLTIVPIWLIELHAFFTHSRLARGVGVMSPGVQFPHPYLLLASTVMATLASAGALGLAVPTLVRDPSQRTPTRLASSTAAALTGLVLLAFWVSAFSRAPGILSYFLFLGLVPGIPAFIIVRATRRFRAESPKRRAILALAIALLALWAVASTVNFFVLWSGLVTVMGRPRARSWALVMATAVVYVAVGYVAIVLLAK